MNCTQFPVSKNGSAVFLGECETFFFKVFEVQGDSQFTDIQSTNWKLWFGRALLPLAIILVQKFIIHSFNDKLICYVLFTKILNLVETYIGARNK